MFSMHSVPFSFPHENENVIEGVAAQVHKMTVIFAICCIGGSFGFGLNQYSTNDQDLDGTVAKVEFFT